MLLFLCGSTRTLTQHNPNVCMCVCVCSVRACMHGCSAVCVCVFRVCVCMYELAMLRLYASEWWISIENKMYSRSLECTYTGTLGSKCVEWNNSEENEAEETHRRKKRRRRMCISSHREKESRARPLLKIKRGYFVWETHTQHTHITRSKIFFFSLAVQYFGRNIDRKTRALHSSSSHAF